MADTSENNPAKPDSRMMHFPITFYAVTMGLLGLTLAFHAAINSMGWTAAASGIMLWVSVAAFLAITLGYLAKAILHPKAVLGEWNHPVRVAFFPAASISLLLMAVAFLGSSQGVANLLWLTGTALQGVLMLSIVARWIGHKPFEYAHINPAWFIPAVGNVIVPIAGVPLGYTEISWLFFSAGLMFWIILLTLVMNRLIFHTPLPGRLLPTLVILIAPPAVAFTAYTQLVDQIDAFARVLLNLGYVFGLIVLTQAPKIARLPFAMSFWALSFPVAALTIASFRFGVLAGSPSHTTIGLGLLALLVLIIAALVLRTLLEIMRGDVCQPE